MNIKNFNINNILKNSSASQRAMILFDEATKITFLNESSLKESEREILLDSFKTSQEIDIYNEYYTHYNRFDLLISEIEKSQLKIENFQLTLSTVIDDIYEKGELVKYIISSLDEILSKKIIAKNKEKEFMVDAVTMISSLQEKTISQALLNLHKERGEKNDNEIQTFVKLFQSRIEKHLGFIRSYQELLQEKYKKFDVKFKAVEQKIANIDENILEIEDFINGFCKVFTDKTTVN